MTIVATSSRNAPRLPAAASDKHLFSVGQSVRLRGGFQPSSAVYLITATLPSNGDSLQYRIRSETERFERVATQASLELVGHSGGDEKLNLAQTSFGADQATHHDKEIEEPALVGSSSVSSRI